MEDLKGQCAVVTGGGSGIGRQTSIKLAEAGARLAVVDINAQAARETCALLREQGAMATDFAASTADSGQVHEAFEKIEKEFGKIDILVNNAGVSGNQPALDLSDADWRQTMSVNLDGVFYCAREAGRRMRPHGGGKIVNIGSMYSVAAAPNRISYCASKAAVEMMTRVLAIEWAEYNIRVNAVGPGYVDTALVRELAQDNRLNLEALVQRIPQKRLATLDDIAETILFLCEARSAHMTGQILVVDGGWTAYGYV